MGRRAPFSPVVCIFISACLPLFIEARWRTTPTLGTVCLRGGLSYASLISGESSGSEDTPLCTSMDSSSIPVDAAPGVPATAPFVLVNLPEQWKCDYCTAKFATFEEACLHEEGCSSKSQSTTPQEQPPSSTRNAPPKSSLHGFFAPRNNQDTPVPITNKATRKPPRKGVVSSKKMNSKDDTSSSKRSKSPTPAPAKKQRSSPDVPVAAIFGGKSFDQLMKEQRQVEFQVQIRKKQEQERSRSVKQQKDSVFSAKSLGPTKPKKPAPKRRLLPLAPRFPQPSHVLGDAVVSCVPCPSSILAHSKKSHFPSVDCTQLETPLIPRQLLSCMSPDQNDLLRAWARLLWRKHKPEPMTCSVLWSDRYGLQAENTAILSAENQSVANELRQWIQEWKLARDRAMERMAQKQKKLAKDHAKGIKKVAKKKSVYKDDVWESEDNDDMLHQLCLITGPTGSGKTSLVHRIVKELQCQVLEINTTQARGASALKHKIQEATQSCSSLDLLSQKQQPKIASLFAAQQAVVDSDSEAEDEVASAKSSVTVILLDEVDLLWESNGDAGFWTTLLSLAKTAKCPIILTATDKPPELHHCPLTLKWFQLERPTSKECVPFLIQVIRQEGLDFRPSLHGHQIETQLAIIADKCGRDIRRLCLELQTFALRPDFSSPAEDSQATLSAHTSTESHQSCASLRIKSVVPSSVTAHAYSVLTIKGENFHLLSQNITVWVGSRPCPKCLVVDSSTILALSPPSPLKDPKRAWRCSERFAMITIVDHGGDIRLRTTYSDSILSKPLANGTHFIGVQKIWIEYKFDLEKVGPSRSEIDSEKNALDIWNNLLSNLQVEKVEANQQESSQKSKCNEASVLEMEEWSTEALRMSDAAFLEENLTGVPCLAGACHGFGYDMTPEEDPMQVQEGTMRKYENIRPPAEEKLFDTQWKETAFFFGQSDCFVTGEAVRRRERELYKSIVENARRLQSHCPESKGEEHQPDFARPDRFLPEEDMFVVCDASPDLLCLPFILQHSCRKASQSLTLEGYEGLIAQRKQFAGSQEELMRNIFAHDVQGKVPLRFGSRKILDPLASFFERMDQSLFVDYIPFLRKIAQVDRANQYAFEKLEIEFEQAVNARRRTRRKKSDGYASYFDTISKALRLDTSEMTTSEVTEKLATSSLEADRGTH